MADTIADMITRIRNGQQRRLVSVSIPYSKFKAQILDVLKEEGYIYSHEKKDIRDGVSMIDVDLKYTTNGTPVIQEIHKVSKCGRRVYSAIEELSSFYNNLGVVILSTSKGVFSDRRARQENVGGEVICKVF